MDTRAIRSAQIAFGAAVRTRRKSAGLSQEQLAALAGVHRNYVGDVERAEENISLVKMLRIANALKVPLHELLREINAPCR